MEEIDFSKLPKKERKRLKREMEREEQGKKEKVTDMVKWLIAGLFLLLVLLGAWWLLKEISKPLPGQTVVDQGREHVKKEEWEKFAYNSNPPTSGPHDAEWKRGGVYSEPQGDGNLIHSLEHGYVVISYNCQKQFSTFPASPAGGHLPFSIAFAHETDEPHEESATNSAEASPSAEQLSDVWKSSECEELKKKLSDLANEKRLWKLIVVPRPSLDVGIALTAWTRIDKMDEFDKERISRFIDAFRDKGPEKTME